MDFSPTSAGLFRDLGGLAAMIQRLQAEVTQFGRLSDAARGKEKVGESRAEHVVSYSHRLLLKSLLRAIALASYAPGTAARPLVRSLWHGACLPCCCCWNIVSWHFE